MKSVFALSMPLLLFACSSGTAANDPVGIASLSWMEGAWVDENDGRWTEERWSSERGRAMLGTGRSGDAVTMESFEFLRLSQQEDGSVVYYAAPGGGDATAFTLVESDGQSAVFTNPDHDFPQRIAYLRDAETMSVEISLMDGGQTIGWQLTLED